MEYAAADLAAPPARGDVALSSFTTDNDGGFSWEKTDLADALKRAVQQRF
jgi:hypothetical protein